MNLKLNLSKKTITIAICIAISLITITTGLILIFARKSIKGTEAAKILLAREKMNTTDTAFSWSELTNQVNKILVNPSNNSKENVVLADSSSELGSLIFDESFGQIYEKDNFYNYQNISGSSSDGSVIGSRLKNVEFEAQRSAELIDYLKNKLNIVDKWVKQGYNLYFLHVIDNSEILLNGYTEKGNIDHLRVLKRTTLENASSIYEMMYTDLDTGKVDNPVYSLYIPGERYEYCYEHDGNAKDYLIADNENGYWNVMMLDDDRFQNVIINGDLAYSTSYNFDSQDLTYDKVINSALKEDIISFDDNSISLALSAFDGVKDMLIDKQYVYYTEHNEVGGYTVDYLDAKNFIINTKNGKTIKYNDTYVYNSQQIKLSFINFDFFNNVSIGEESQYDLRLNFEVENTLSLKEKFAIVKAFCQDMGLTPQYDLNDLEECIIKNSEISKTMANIYKWKDHFVNSTEEVSKGRDVLFETINELFGYYSKYKDYEVVSGFERGRVSKSLDFAKIDNFVLDSATYQNEQVNIVNAKMTINKSKLLVENAQYVLKIGLARINEKNEFLSQNTVELHTLNTLENVTYQKGDLTVSGSAIYDIPLILDEGKYVIVAYVATSSEGIRVSKMYSFGFVDTQNKVLETDLMQIKVTQNNDKHINIEYFTKLRFDIELTYYTTISYQDVRRVIMTKVLSCGYPIYDASIQTEDGTIVDDSSIINVGTTYKMKFRAHTKQGDIDAYVYCKVITN